MAEDTSLAAPLQRLHEAGREHISQFTSGLAIPLLRVLSLESDYGEWLKVINGRPEARELVGSHRDLGLALYAVAAGIYRPAFAGLRSFIEVAVTTIRLSASEFERRQWVNGRKDISWSSITSADTGIYSIQFLREFSPESTPESSAFRETLRESYRRCSEYLHGSVATTALLPERLEYRQSIGEEWLQLAECSLVSIQHCMFVRYFAELEPAHRVRVEPLLEQNLGHVRSVRIALGLPLEDLPQ